MTSILRLPHERKPRFLRGCAATVGWELTRDRAVYWCQPCNGFHISTGQAVGAVRGSCPETPEGAPLVFLLCGPVPRAILWAVHDELLNPEARRELERALEFLDLMIATPETAA